MRSRAGLVTTIFVRCLNSKACRDWLRTTNGNKLCTPIIDVRNQPHVLLTWGRFVRPQKATIVGESAVILVATMFPWTCARRFPDASYWSIVNLPSYDDPSALTTIFCVI